MGKDKAAAAAAKKARTLAKTAKKGDKKTKKLASQTRADDSEDEDVDMDAVLAKYHAEQAAREAVHEQVVDRPTVRINATLTAPLPGSAGAQRRELFLFGGEHYDGSLSHFYNDLHVYNVDRNTWTRHTSRTAPMARSSHQCVATNDGIYLFGGELSSPKGNEFRHFADMWLLDPRARSWRKVETRTPPARSGHRMCLLGNRYIVLFGGFQDTSQSTKYLDDLWAYELETEDWVQVKLPAVGARPEARSGGTLVPNGADECVLIGGYAKKKVSGKLYKGVVLNDYWTLRTNGAAPGSGSWTWHRRKRPANAPTPRVGAACCMHRNRLISFGGVFDTKEGEETLSSVFYNTCHALSVGLGKWYELKVRPPRKQPASAKSAAPASAKPDRDRDLLEIEARLNGQTLSDTAAGTVEDTPEEEVQSVALRDIPATMTMPHPRFNSCAACSGETLFVYSGVYEAGEREYTLDDMHAIDLAKLDGVRRLWGSEIQVEERDGSDEDDDGCDEDDGEEDDEAGKEEKAVAVSDPNAVAADPHAGEVDESRPADDPRPAPLPFENLRKYWWRTQPRWLFWCVHYTGLKLDPDGKEMRTEAFVRAEEFWWLERERVRELEDAQLEAGFEPDGQDGEEDPTAQVVTKEDTARSVGQRR